MSSPRSTAGLRPPWKPGQSGNPAGTTVKLPSELRQARRENMVGLIRLIHLYVGMPREQAKQRLAGPAALQLEEMVQGQIERAAEGDSRAFQFLIEIMCGKIPEADIETPADHLTPREKIDVLKKAIVALEEQVEPPGS